MSSWICFYPFPKTLCFVDCAVDETRAQEIVCAHFDDLESKDLTFVRSENNIYPIPNGLRHLKGDSDE